MALSVVDLYAKILPKTNCKDCGFSTCIAFAGMVVSEKHPLKNCPHIDPALLTPAEQELAEQYKAGKWLKKDMAAEALGLAKEKTAAMTLEKIAARVGGIFRPGNKESPFKGEPYITLPYFNTTILVTKDRICDAAGNDLSRNEQTFVYIHLAFGGTSSPTGNMKSFKEFPNTVSKIISMEDHVEAPLKKTFSSRMADLKITCARIGGKDVKHRYESPDLAFQFQAFPMVFVTLLFWDENQGFEADVKLLFDETIIDHMDIEAMMFLSEYLCKRLEKEDA